MDAEETLGPDGVGFFLTELLDALQAPPEAPMSKRAAEQLDRLTAQGGLTKTDLEDLLEGLDPACGHITQGTPPRWSRCLDCSGGLCISSPIETEMRPGSSCCPWPMS